MSKRVTVICDSFNEQRYYPHNYLLDNNRISSLNFIKLNRVKSSLFSIPGIVINLFFQIFKKDTIIIACAPLNPLVLYFIFLKFIRKDIIYDSSYVYWGKRYMYIKNKYLIVFFEKIWFLFLRNIRARAVNSITKSFLSVHCSKVYLIPHSIKLDVFKKENLVSDDNKFKVLFVGKVEYKKGLDCIIKLAHCLKNVEFLIVGSGDYVENIRKEKLDNIILKGRINSYEILNQIYNESDLFLLPSRKYNGWEELFGIVIIEAMATGLPVIATRCVGPKEIIKNNYNGILVDIDDINMMKEYIEKFQKDTTFYNSISNNSIKRAKTYSLSNISKKFYNLIYEE